MKRTPPFSIRINACPCDGIRDLAEDFPGLQRGEERWELNVRSNGGYQGGKSSEFPPQLPLPALQETGVSAENQCG